MSLTRFGAGDIVISTDSLVTSTWTGNVNNLQNHWTQSIDGGVFGSPTSSGWFHLDVYQTSSLNSEAEIQYSIGYGNRLGSGSPDFTNDSGSHGMNAARATYGAYRNLVYGDENQNFTFNTHVPDDIWVINVARSRYKQSLKPGTLNLVVSASLSGSPTVTMPIHLTDDSVTSNGSAKLTNLGRQFNINSGSSGIVNLDTMGGTSLQHTDSGSYGLFYPDAGVIILNPDAFGQNPPADLMIAGKEHYGTPAASAANSGSFLTPNRHRGEMRNYNGTGVYKTGRLAGRQNNPAKLYQAISGGLKFIVDTQEKITSQYYFARAKNFEYNYTTNPSFTDSKGNLTYSSMINNPVTYITTVGLYNDSNDLVAVAKISQPVVKDFTKEALIRVKLDY